MTSNVQNRKDIRESFAALLVAAIEGTGKPAQKVYPYRVSDFGGRKAVCVLASAPANRSKQAQVTRVSSRVRVDVHNFVWYADQGEQSSNSPAAGASVVIRIPNTENYQVGDVVTVEDASHLERATVTAVTTGQSITVNTLVYSYTRPVVHWWTERDAEDRLDWMEQEVSKVVMDNDTNETWAQVSFAGDHTHDDITIGGKPYLHEIIHLEFQLHSD